MHDRPLRSCRLFQRDKGQASLTTSRAERRKRNPTAWDRSSYIPPQAVSIILEIRRHSIHDSLNDSIEPDADIG
jgi:hypothetical protein